MDIIDNLNDITSRIRFSPPRQDSSHYTPAERLQKSKAAPDWPFSDSGMPSPLDNAKDAASAAQESGATDQPIPLGMRLDLKELYRDNKKDAWGEWTPEDTDTGPEEAPETKTYALIVRREILNVPGLSLTLHSITVQSPLIRKVLGVVFDGYRGMTTKLKDLTFKTPFHEFFYRWDRFQQQIEEERDDLVLDHMRLLQSVISREIQPHLDKRQDLLANRLVTFDYLWALFEPDAVIYKQTDGQDRLYKLVDSSYRKTGGSETLNLTCRYIDCDGAAFGYITTSLILDYFDGTTPISELPVIPIKLHPQICNILERLWKRGRSFAKLNGFRYKSYSGLCTVKEEGYYGTFSKQNIDNGRIIVDTMMWSTYNPEHSSDLEALDDPLAGVQSNEDDLFTLMSHELVGDDDNPYTSACGPIDAIGYNILRRMSRRRRPNKRQIENPTSLTDDQAFFCTPIVRGYCLTSKQWVHFYVENIREISWNLEAFRRLVLPHDYKEIIWAFVESQLDRERIFDDVVQGKGQGIIMLLSGEPGVGKTLTAESVAEEMRKPLYSMSAGELGYSAGEVERRLHKVLELSTKWGAILLIDECDVFLEKRTTSNIERNKLVSVFLRLLEYYKGVMFLTTNRVSTFDAAFQSRIHLTIDYPKLDLHSKMLIWQTFVRPQSDASKYSSAIKEKDIRALAKIDMNGREIKNTVKTARLLASQKRVPLAMEHVATVLRVKDRSSAVEELPKSMATANPKATVALIITVPREIFGRKGLVHLMLLPFRMLIVYLQKGLGLLVDRLHRTDASKMGI